MISILCINLILPANDVTLHQMIEGVFLNNHVVLFHHITDFGGFFRISTQAVQRQYFVI